MGMELIRPEWNGVLPFDTFFSKALFEIFKQFFSWKYMIFTIIANPFHIVFPLTHAGTTLLSYILKPFLA